MSIALRTVIKRVRFSSSAAVKSPATVRLRYGRGAQVDDLGVPDCLFNGERLVKRCLDHRCVRWYPPEKGSNLPVHCGSEGVTGGRAVACAAIGQLFDGCC